MKILHATDTYAPTVGGIEVLVHDLAAHQAAAGHDVTVLTRTPGPTGVDSNGVMVVRDARAMRALVAEADMVHAHVSAISPLALRAAEIAAAQRVPAVATVHSMWAAAWPLFRAAALARGWDQLSIQWTAVSEAAADPVRRVLGGRPVLILPNAVDTDLWAAAHAADSTPSGQERGPVTIVSVMRVARRKRPLRLLAVLRRVRAALPSDVEVRVVLVGDGPQLGRLQARISDWGMQGWVEAPGALEHHQIRALYERADVFVAPATLESFGIAALEARASGLAVVARAGTGVADFVADGVEGLLARTDAEMVGQLALLCTDAAARARIQRHNATVRPAYDWSDVLWRTTYAYDAAAELTAGTSRSAQQAPLKTDRPRSAA
ncbi:glycosyltransferase family 4 protein [Pedococcus bigeumensis]|uniref:D-inositol 3-phosphate glycosyltransferase n=1 Tax=Pedococcus bigeumensis TaxID=433644 RepID=A0A502CUM1_9MICO|nr:glycosyltransferase family 4 protein [Pedococcus bigeumensis]TPG16937.1 glycosyltransferase family 1 protein [Pedococcus bigeumensis]